MEVSLQGIQKKESKKVGQDHSASRRNSYTTLVSFCFVYVLWHVSSWFRQNGQEGGGGGGGGGIERK
jgi:hypothetical protein